jgi:hypothetical protein
MPFQESSMNCAGTIHKRHGCGVRTGKGLCSMPVEKTGSGKWTLLELVDHYENHSRDESGEYKRFFSGLKNRAEAIRVIANAEYKQLRHSHQRRLTRESLKDVFRVLNVLEKSGKLRKGYFRTFTRLFEEVKRSLGKIHGVGPLMIYDTAHRLGLLLGLEPESVHLHAGAAEGARKLGIVSRNGIAENGPVLGVLLERLAPSEVEDFLCRYKSHF